MRLEFRIEVTRDDNGTVLIRCPQLPIVASFAEEEDEVQRRATDAVETALGSMINEGEDIPAPDGLPGATVRLPLLTALKVQLYWALRQAGITRAELARRLDWNRNSVDRLFDLGHRSRVEQLEAAFQALGREVEIEVRAAA